MNGQNEEEQANHSLSITVQDSTIKFEGSKTICVSQVGNFEGTPSNATQVTTSNFEEVINAISSDTRLLLKRSEEWSTDGRPL